MFRTFRIRAPLVGVLLSAAWCQTLPTFASIPITLDTTDGYTFSVLQKTVHLSGISQLPLGPNFATTPTLVELIQQAASPATLRAVFPGQGGQTIQIDTGDPILFEYAAEAMPFQVRLTSLGTPGFGGGLGNTIEFDTMADLQGSGEGIANINLPNLGFLNQIQSMSLLLGNDGAFLAQHNLGVDLNGDGTNNSLTINNAILAFFFGPGENPPGFFDYSVSSPPDGDLNLSLNFDFPPDRRVFNTVFTVNPSVGLTLDTVEWTMTQEIVIPAVPEPSGLALLSCLIAGLTLARGRSRHAGPFADLSR
jgi:hypothetical protein